MKDPAPRGRRYYSLLGQSTKIAHKGRRYYPLVRTDGLSLTLQKCCKQSMPTNTQTPSALQGGPEQPRDSSLRSRSFSHGRLRTLACKKRAAEKRGFRSEVAILERRKKRSFKTRTNRQLFRAFKQATSKHCVDVAPHTMLSPGALEASLVSHKPQKYQAERWLFKRYKEPPRPKNKHSNQTSCLKISYNHNLRIGTLNCKGLKPHGEDVKQHLLIQAMRSQNIDILFLQETHLNTNSCEVVQGHTFIYSTSITDEQRKQADENRKDARNRANGGGNGHRQVNTRQTTLDREFHGVAVILNPFAKLHLSDYEQISGRLMSISLHASGPPIHILNAYAPQSATPSQTKEAFYDCLESHFNSFPRAHVRYIVGDFNVRLHAKCDHEYMLGPHIFGRGLAYLHCISSEVMENRRLFLSFCAGCDLFVMNTWFDKPAQKQLTFREPASKHEPPWTPDRFAQLDFVLAPNRWKNSIKDVSARPELFIDSDHYIVVTDCRVRLQAKNEVSRPLKYRMPTAQQKEHFNQFIAQLMQKNVFQDADSFLDAVQQAEMHCFTRVPREQRRPYISPSTWQKITRRNEAHERHDWMTVNQLNVEIKRDARKDKRRALLHTLEQCRTEKEKWEGPKILKSKKIVKFTKLKDRHGNRVGYDKRAEAIADYLYHVQWQPEQLPPNRERGKVVRTQLEINCNPITSSEIISAIQKMKAGKAPGHDCISIDTIKALNYDNCELLTQVLNQWWIHESIPNNHLLAKVVSIFKKGNTQDLANYRPISLLTCAYKIFASVLQARIAAVCDVHLAATQYGFRAARSTQQPLFIARRIQDIAEQSGSDLLLVFLDWEKAFDKINHERMFEALNRMNFPPKILRIIKALYAAPCFHVQHDEFISGTYVQNCGIRQGCPLSPYLFVIVMSVMFSDIRAEHHRILSHGKLDHVLFSEILYADDTVLVTRNTRTMNVLLHAVEQESHYYGLKLNQSKCAAVTTNRRHGIKFRDGTPVPHEEHVTYLGGIVTRNVNVGAEIENRISATMATWRRMHLFFSQANCPIHWKLVVYNSMIRSKLLYGLETLELTTGLLSKLEAVQLRGLRKILHMSTTYINRANTNLEVYRRANQAIATRQGQDSSLTWSIQQCIEVKRIKLTGHLLRANNNDPMRQVSFLNDSAAPYRPNSRRPGRPRKNWMVTSLELCWKKLHNIPFVNSQEQQSQLLEAARQRLF